MSGVQYSTQDSSPDCYRYHSQRCHPSKLESIQDVSSSRSQAWTTTSARDCYFQHPQEVGVAASSRPSSSETAPIASVSVLPLHHVKVTPLVRTSRRGRSPPMAPSQRHSHSCSLVHKGHRSSPRAHSTRVRTGVVPSQGKAYEGTSQQSRRSWSPSTTSSRGGGGVWLFRVEGSVVAAPVLLPSLGWLTRTARRSSLPLILLLWLHSCTLGRGYRMPRQRVARSVALWRHWMTTTNPLLPTGCQSVERLRTSRPILTPGSHCHHLGCTFTRSQSYSSTRVSEVKSSTALKARRS